jgi:transcriptional regulator with XRE-family HTH domain
VTPSPTIPGPYNAPAMAGRPPTKEAPPFGRRLAAARHERGLTQRELAERMGVSREMMDYYERRARNPALGVIEQAADALGISVAELMGIDEKAPAVRKKRGPASALEQRIERIKRLPRSEQEFVLKFLDTVLERAEKAS